MNCYKNEVRKQLGMIYDDETIKESSSNAVHESVFEYYLLSEEGIEEELDFKK